MIYGSFKYPTVLSDILLVHISGFVHPKRTKIAPFDSEFHDLFTEVNFVSLQCYLDDISSLEHFKFCFVYKLETYELIKYSVNFPTS